jgi:hypothetical protein
LGVVAAVEANWLPDAALDGALRLSKPVQTDCAGHGYPRSPTIAAKLAEAALLFLASCSLREPPWKKYTQHNEKDTRLITNSKPENHQRNHCEMWDIANHLE